MISNDIVNARAAKNHIARAPQKRLKIAHFELLFENSNGIFRFLLCLFPTRPRAPKISAKKIMKTCPVFVACKSDQ